MGEVEKDIQERYFSPLVDHIRASGNVLALDNMTVRLARHFGFCNGVRRAIETAHAARLAFPGRRIFLIGEIIHNPDVNRTLDEMGLHRLPWKECAREFERLESGDVVLIPAFGVSVPFRRLLEEKGVVLVDATCGDVMRVWRQVARFAQNGVTSVIHGKATHEETVATASHARGEDGQGHFIIVYTREDVECLAGYILGTGSREEFMNRFARAVSPGFDPDVHLKSVGMANQTTMLEEETRLFQQILRAAVMKRDGGPGNFRICDTICSATQDRQSALTELLAQPLDALFVVGGYNSSNTAHLAEIARRVLPAACFVSGADCVAGLRSVRSFDIRTREERETALPPEASDLSRRWVVGVTAGASCPASKIEGLIRRLAGLRRCSLPE